MLTSLGTGYGLLGMAQAMIDRISAYSLAWNWAFYVSAVIVGSCAPLLYLFASGYLLGESIRQLLILPPGCFQLPNLSIYLPSFS